MNSSITLPMVITETAAATAGLLFGRKACHTDDITTEVSSRRTPSATVRMTMKSDAARLRTAPPKRLRSSS